MPTRIQRKRTKGYKTPPNTKYCGRPSQWGNPFEVGDGVTREQAVARFALHIDSLFLGYFYNRDHSLKALYEWLEPLLDMEHLSCWCREDQACHVDVIIDLVKKYKEQIKEQK